jgi:hypothetical protein
MIENNNDSVKNKKTLNESYQDCHKHTGGGNFRDDDLSTKHSFNKVDKENEVEIAGINQIYSFNKVDKENEVKIAGINQISEFHSENE